MSKNIQHILRALKQGLQQQFHDEIEDVVLFGSQVTGTAREDSDYDVLIVLNRDTYDWTYRDRVFDVVYNVSLMYDILIDMFLISTHELKHSLRGVQPVFTNALQHGMYA